MKATFKSCCIRCVLHNIDGDGRTLAQELFQDGTNPLQPDTPHPPPKAQVLSPSPTEDLDWEI